MTTPTYPVLNLLIGLPCSGKSTFALHGLLPSLNYAPPVVCPDAIRQSFGHAFYRPLERLVWASAHLMVHSLFGAGHPFVTLDATNSTRARRDEWRSRSYLLHAYHLATPLNTCLHRAKENSQPQLFPIIQKMHEEWEPPKPEEFDYFEVVHPEWTTPPLPF